MLASRLSPLALAIGSAILLAACGGGGGGGSTSSGGGTATPTSVTVTPSLGKFSTGCDVVLLDVSGNTLGSGKIGSDGAATIAVGSYTGTDGAFTLRSNGLNAQIKDVAAQRAALDARMEAVGNRYKAQFVAMDALVGQMSSTSNYLAQQLASLSNQTG